MVSTYLPLSPLGLMSSPHHLIFSPLSSSHTASPRRPTPKTHHPHPFSTSPLRDSYAVVVPRLSTVLESKVELLSQKSCEPLLSKETGNSGLQNYNCFLLMSLVASEWFQVISGVFLSNFPSLAPGSDGLFRFTLGFVTRCGPLDVWLSPSHRSLRDLNGFQI